MDSVAVLWKEVREVLEAAGMGEAFWESRWIVDAVLEEGRVGVRQRALCLARRRASGEPLQHVLGWVDFLGLKLKCDGRALIPRPETEELAACLLERLPPQARVLDLGTGCGALVLALARVWNRAVCVGVDVSVVALELAAENALACGLENRVKWLLSNWFSALREEEFSLIVANPPYLSEGEHERLEPSVRCFEPKGAFVAGKDAGQAVKKIVEHSVRYLSKGGVLALELALGQSSATKSHALRSGFGQVELVKDLSARERFLIAHL